LPGKHTQIETWRTPETGHELTSLTVKRHAAAQPRVVAGASDGDEAGVSSSAL
jgi:hypothetical protein